MSSMRVFSTGILVSLALVFSANCGGDDAKVEKQEVILNVKTVDMSGKPVEMVRFYINGKKYGITNEDGVYRGRYPAKEGEVLAFNVMPPEGYSISPDEDQSKWQYTVQYPAGSNIEVEFNTKLQRPERSYLFLVRTGVPTTPIKVSGKLVGKTGESGDAIVRVNGVPGMKFTAQAGTLTMAGAVFAEEDEIYVLTDKKKGPLGAVEVADAADAAEAAPPKTPTPAPPSAADLMPTKPSGETTTTVVAMNDTPTPRRPDPPAPARVEDDEADTIEASPSRDDDRVEVVQDDPDPTPPSDNGAVDNLFDDDEEDEIPGRDDDPAPADPVVADDVMPEPDVVPDNSRSSVTRRGRRQGKATGQLTGGLLEDEGTKVEPGAIDSNVGTAGTGPTGITSMSRAEISSRVKSIKSKLGASNILVRKDVDFLKQIDETHPSYYEANRLLADYYYRQKDYKRQASALEEATRRGRYKSDPAVLLSLAKAYARHKRYRKAIKTMRRVEAKMRRLPVDAKIDAYRFYAEMLEFEFLKESAEDPKRANISLLDKAITKWERVITLSGGGGKYVSKARKTIEKLTQRKRDLEL